MMVVLVNYIQIARDFPRLIDVLDDQGQLHPSRLRSTNPRAGTPKDNRRAFKNPRNI